MTLHLEFCQPAAEAVNHLVGNTAENMDDHIVKECGLELYGEAGAEDAQVELIEVS